jgi:hypothetical protein
MKIVLIIALAGFAGCRGAGECRGKKADTIYSLCNATCENDDECFEKCLSKEGCIE